MSAGTVHMYYGFTLSEKGMKPDPEKIQEIWETPELTNYMKRFTHDYSTQTQHLWELLQEDNV